MTVRRADFGVPGMSFVVSRDIVTTVLADTASNSVPGRFFPYDITGTEVKHAVSSTTTDPNGPPPLATFAWRVR